MINCYTFIYKREALHCAAANMLSTLTPTLKKKIYWSLNKVWTSELLNIANDLHSEHRMTEDEKDRRGELEMN